jgi:hypothetical protein
MLHAVQGQLERAFNERGVPGTPIGTGGVSNWTYGEARGVGVMAHRVTFPKSACSPDCIAAQLDAYHQQGAPDGPGVNNQTPVRSDPVPKPSDVLTNAQQAEVTTARAFVLGGL